MSWKKTTLSEVCSLITDGKHGDCENQENSGYYFVSAKDVRNGKLNYEKARQITYQSFAPTHRRTDLKPNDILITNSGTIGRMAIARDVAETEKTTFQKSVAVLKPIRDRVDAHFLYYYLRANKKKLTHSAGGAAQKNLLLGSMRKFEIEIPTVEKQVMLASIIRPYDDLIENNRRRIVLLEEAARQLYKEWFVRFRFPGHEHTTFVDGVPEGWERLKVGDLVKRRPAGKLFSQKTVEADGAVPVLDQGAKGVIGYHNESASVDADNDHPIIVFANHTCNQKLVHFPFSTIQNVLPFNASQNAKRNIYWLHYATMGLVKLNGYKGHWPELMAKNIILPPTEICEEFGKIVRPSQIQMFVLEQQISKLTKARDLLLPRLMNGDIAV